MKDTATLYRTQCEALRDLPPDMFKKTVLGLWDFEMDGIEPEDPVVKMAIGLVRPLIDRRNARGEAAKKAAAARWSGCNTDAIRCDSMRLDANECDSMRTGAIAMRSDAINTKGLNTKDKKIKDLKDIVVYEYTTVLNYLNEKAGTSFRNQSKDSRKHIKARFDEGFTVEDFKTVIDKKVSEWKGTDMEKYLRPSTLFGTKFEGYLNQKTGAAGGFANFAHSGRDWDDLAYQIMEEQ